MKKEGKDMGSHISGKRHILLTAFTVAFICALIFALNYYTPLYGDDYLYAYSFETGEKLTALEQVIPSQMSHYQTMNGRFIVHTFAQVFQLLGDGIFNIMNSVFFVVLLLVIYYHGYGTFKGFSLKRFIGIFVLLFLSCPAFGQSFLWMTGAANYLYGLLIVLLFLIPYRKQAGKQFAQYGAFKEILFAVSLFAFGVIAGWTNENTVAALLIMCVLYCVLGYLKNKKLHIWSITGFIGVLIGFAFMLIAPGTLNRMDKFGGSGGIGAWIKRAILYTCDIFTNTSLIIILLVVVLCVYFTQKRELLARWKPKELLSNFSELGVSAVYLLGFLASVYAMVVAPLFPGRAWTCCVTLLIIVVCNIEGLLDLSISAAKTGRIVALLLAVTMCAGSYVNAFYELKNVTVAYNNRNALIAQAQEKGERTVELPTINGETGYCAYGASGDLSEDSSNFPNYAIAQYFGFEEVKRK